MTNFISQLVFKMLSVVLGITFTFTGLGSSLNSDGATGTPNDFTPVVRFVVCSDIHLDGDENQQAAKRFANLFNDMYEYAEGCEYKNLDAVLVAGDFTGGGAEKEYQIYTKIINENKKDETQVLTILGNHEFIDYRDVDATVGYDVFRKYIKQDVDTDIVINGYHFIGVSYDDNGKTFSGKTKWLDERLKNATAEDPDKPVFVYQHPHPALTVYGSVNWGDVDTRAVLSKYPQVVNFSGHSHYAASDPRSVWQGEFTAVGCGSLSAFMGNLNYIEGDKDAPGNSGGAWLVEVDANGNVSMRLYDIENRMFFDNIDYYFTDLSKTSKRTYTWRQQKALDTVPEFPEGATVTSYVDENGDTIITFPEAEGYYPAENYKIKVTRKSKTVYSGTVISEYVRATDDDVTVNLGQLSSGEYKVKIVAYSPYAKKGEKIKQTITVE
ncbi:MAG: metallophosphoesterase [Clostridia bacterium]|nr:metallophosphoesterase [Clostridia bacterium]